jgi:asparagine synthase (glutamine-hydrolysing)
MCGIIGVIGDQKHSLPLDLLHHRGPDANGLWKSGKVYLGHTRLSIIDLSDDGSQPKTDFTERFTITFNGEIFNFREIKKQLKDYPYNSNSDTEVILAAYSIYGYETPKYLKGQFAFAIWDSELNELFVARDRMGEKPFYYHQDGEQFIFASELRSLIATGIVPKRIDNSSLQEYLSYQSVCPPNTLLENVFQLPAATCGIFKNGVLSTELYWDISISRDIEYTNLHEIRTEIKAKLSESVKFQMVSDVSLGAFLSGGIDSSAIVGLMAEQSLDPIQTFSVSFEDKRFDESKYASIIANKFNTKHTNILLDVDDFKSKLPEILSKIDNPSGDGPNTFIVSEAVKKAGLTVALSGLGGDELFAGYNGFKRYYGLQKISPFWKASMPLRWAISKFCNGKFRDLLKFTSLDLAHIYSLDRMVFSNDEIEFLLGTRSKDRLISLLMGKQDALSELPFLSQYSIAELLSYTSNVLLKDTDQMSMANSLEVRVPFFDHDLIEYVTGIPDEFKYPKYPKSLLVESLGTLLPNEIVNRPKMGFSFPWDEWLRTNLKTYCESSLIALSKRELFKEGQILKLWEKFLKNDRSVNWSKIWLLVTLEQWMKNIKI